jgi:hypothetical protein
VSKSTKEKVMEVGTRIKGKYMGEFPITGTVVDRRPIYVRTDGCILHTIELDEPTDIMGMVRERVLMHTLYDGSPSSYVQYTDVMEKI